jgi:hypothetical protein
MKISNGPRAAIRRSMGRTGVLALIIGCVAAAGGTAAQARPAQGPACAPTAADEQAALRLAAACKTRVEVLSEKTELVQAYALPDGTRSMEIAVVPQRVRRDGVWKTIDTSLRADGAGRLRPVATAEDVSFSGGGDGPLVTLVSDGDRFEMSWPTPLPAPVVSGSTATYPEVLAGVDLAVEATRTGYRHVLVVKTAEALRSPALTQIRYRTSGDLRPVSVDGGGLGLVDAAGKASPWQSHAASMWDSAYNPALGGEVLPAAMRAADVAPSTISGAGPAANSAPVTVTVSGTDVLVAPDATLMSTGTLPVYIDPPWQNPTAPTFAYADNPNSDWDVRNEAWVGQNPYDGRLFRSYFRFGVSALAGKRITSARFDITLDHSGACAGNTAYLYRSAGIATTPRTAWAPALQLKLASGFGDSNEAGGCGSDQGDDRVLMGSTTFRDDLHNAAAASWSTYTVGLCMCSSIGGSESGTYQWMRFFVANTNLVVGYNSYPGTPADLKTSGVACGGTIGTTSPNLKAQFVDVDGSDTLSSTFEWQELPSGAVNSVAGPSTPANNYGDITLAPTAPEGKSYQWRVQTGDGTDLSPWSGWCGFTVNASPPPAPGVLSTDYPTGATPHGGPGVAGSFTLSNGGAGGADVTSYTYGWTDPPTITTTVAAGASLTVPLTPYRYGYNTLHVYSKDPSGTPGPTMHYQFLVNAPSAPIGHWPLDTIAGHGFNDQQGTAGLAVETANNDVTWAADARYIGESAVAVNTVTETPSAVNGALTTSLPALDTSKAFSVAAWVRPGVLPTGNMTVLSQDGSDAGGFYLGIRLIGSPAVPTWAFAMKDTSASSSTTRYAYGAALTAADVTKWTHLTGVFDPAERRLRLFVDGVAVTSATSGTTPWKATGQLTVGRGFYGGVPADFWKGNVADVRVWTRAAVQDDLTGTDANAVAGTQAVPGILQPTEVANWSFTGGVDCYCGDSIDGSYWGRRLFLTGWNAGTPTSGFVNPGHDSDDALWTAAGGAASTTDPGDGVSRPVVRTDNSLTVSAWVKLTTSAAGDQVVMRQRAATSSSFKLLRDGALNKWSFAVTSLDGSGNVVWNTATSDATVTLNSWVHLVGVFDRGTGKTRLYVNGVLQTIQGSNAVGQPSVSSLEVGNVSAEAFLGSYDQIRIFAGAMSGREVANLFAS